MRIRHIPVASILWMLSAVAPAQTLSSLVFQVYDADSGEPLAARVLADNALLVGGEFKLQKDQEAQIAVEVSTEAGASYRARTFNVFLANLRGSRVYYKVYLARKGQPGTPYSRGSVSLALRHLNQDTVDRAVAMLERIYQESPAAQQATQFSIHLQYNLANALYLNCTTKFIDSCHTAKEVFDRLLVAYDKDASLFNKERVNRASLGAIDLETHDLINQYRRAKWDLSRGRHEAAVETFRLLVDAADNDPNMLGKLKLTQQQLAMDLRFAQERQKAAEADAAR
jgi:hypothetical protein